MAQPSLKAEFFVAPSGVVIQRAAPLKRSEAYKFFKASDRHCKKCRREVVFGGTTVSPFDKYLSGHIDHKFPRSRGGQNDWSNLQVLCISCNCSKGAAV